VAALRAEGRRARGGDRHAPQADRAQPRHGDHRQFRFGEPGTGNHKLPEPPSGKHRFGSEPEPPSGRHRFGSEPEPPSGRHRFGSEPEPPSGKHRFGAEPGTGTLRALPEPPTGNHRFGGEVHTGSQGRPSQGNARDRLRQRFFDQVRETTRALRPYLIGGVLGPRAYEEVRKRFAHLRSEATMNAAGSVMLEALTLCERLTELAQRDLRAMELLGACTAWLAALDPNQPFPITLDGVPALCDAKALLGVR
jgi:hypothetical protein